MSEKAILEQTSAAIRLRNVHAAWGKVGVLHGVDFEVMHGEAVALLGRNGMGKTTTLSCIVGVLKSTQGEIEVMGEIVDGHRPSSVVARGLGYVPERRGIFPLLTVGENLRISRIAGSRWSKERLVELFPDLRTRLHERAGNLSGGQQQMLAISRALSSDPKILVLDEPTAGLAPLIIRQIIDALVQLQRYGLTLLIVEQTMATASLTSNRVLIMDHGTIVDNVTRERFEKDPQTVERHLVL